MKKGKYNWKLLGTGLLGVGILIGCLDALLMFGLLKSGSSVVIIPGILVGLASCMFVLAGAVFLIIHAMTTYHAGNK